MGLEFNLRWIFLENYSYLKYILCGNYLLGTQSAGL